MKIYLTLAIAALVILTPVNYSFAGDEENSTQTQLKDKDVFIKADGMVCDFCVQSLNKVFKKEESVIGIYVDLDKQAVIVDTKDGMELSDEKIKELIEWGGYDLVSIERL